MIFVIGRPPKSRTAWKVRLPLNQTSTGHVTTAVVVLSLGLGIGANTALFSAVNGMLLTKIPARDPDSLDAWLGEWVHGLGSHAEYVEKLGSERWVELGAGEALSDPVNYGEYA